VERASLSSRLMHKYCMAAGTLACKYQMGTLCNKTNRPDTDFAVGPGSFDKLRRSSNFQVH
jgi:hypothetical protein